MTDTLISIYVNDMIQNIQINAGNIDAFRNRLDAVSRAFQDSFGEACRPEDVQAQAVDLHNTGVIDLAKDDPKSVVASLETAMQLVHG